MKDKYLMLCNENMDSFSSLFTMIKEKAPFIVDITNVADILAGKSLKRMKHFRTTHIYIAIEADKFIEVEDQLRDYCNSLEESTAFTNFLYLHKTKAPYTGEDLLKRYKHEYILFDHEEHLAQAIQFNLYMISLFNKSILSNRLADYIYHSFKEVVYYEMLKKQKADIEELNEELAKINKIDNLTNLYNRRALFEFLEKERNRTLRSFQKLGGDDYPIETKQFWGNQEGSSEVEEDFIEYFGIFSIMMIDLDHFKKINDTYGHLIGDKVLKTIGRLLQQQGILRDQDIAGRFGGEEFIVILPNTNANNALGPAMRLAAELDAIEFVSNENQRFKVTLSIGISEYHPTDKDNEAIIYRADQAMYYAKEHGRNQIIIYERVFD
ncbi:MAG: GGDEF domain-containing protein [Spirochaetales bacterium]|nr:GGDEF domain-containing protein [Spirochaetales bacterium]